MFPGPADCGHLAINTPVAESTRHHHGVHALQQAFGSVIFDLLRADPVQIQGGILRQTGVAKSFDHREIGVVQLHVLADQRHLHGGAWVAHLVNQLGPTGHVAVMVFQLQNIEDFAAEAFVLESQRHGVDAVGIE
ncbi:MAG: Uncharacterised protein [Cyanobium sp. ARS6]|nr:MAG: Uncharacterised protein [Cyanobium sp. ARS6]